MDQNKQLHIALGIVVTLILLLSIFTFGWVIGDSEESTNTNQLLVVNSLRTVNTATQPVVQETKLPNLGQSLTDQSRQNVETTNNNIEINIHNSGYYGRAYNYYPRSYHTSSPYRTRYYSGYHPYYRHGFSYQTSYGNGFNYKYY
jgi:hypothetical protein